MLKRLIQAYKKVMEDERRTPADIAADALLNDPLSLESIARLAINIDRGFEIIRPSDGFTLRFYEDGFRPVKSGDEQGYW